MSSSPLLPSMLFDTATTRAAGRAVDLGGLLARARTAELTRRTGVVRSLRGLAIEAQGPRSRVGELCAIVPPEIESRLFT